MLCCFEMPVDLLYVFIGEKTAPQALCSFLIGLFIYFTNELYEFLM